jgi:predicted aldo/keto reductase-like oxidoreductase
MPFANRVWIPHMLELYNHVFVHGELAKVSESHSEPAGQGRIIALRRASRVTNPRNCCPQKIPIADWIQEIHAVLGEGRDPKRE